MDHLSDADLQEVVRNIDKLREQRSQETTKNEGEASKALVGTGGDENKHEQKEETSTTAHESKQDRKKRLRRTNMRFYRSLASRFSQHIY